MPSKPDSNSRRGEPTIRTVVVKTASGEFRIAVVKLCLLRKAEDIDAETGVESVAFVKTAITQGKRGSGGRRREKEKRGGIVFVS